MKLLTLIKAASKHYPDNYILDLHKGLVDGDGLAKFVISEISETYDPGSTSMDQVNEAIRVMDRAIEDLKCVQRGLFELQKQTTWKDRSDLGTENPTRWVQERLDTIVDYRLMQGLPLVVATNATLEELGTRVASRLHRAGQIVAIGGVPYHAEGLE